MATAAAVAHTPLLRLPFCHHHCCCCPRPFGMLPPLLSPSQLMRTNSIPEGIGVGATAARWRAVHCCAKTRSQDKATTSNNNNNNKEKENKGGGFDISILEAYTEKVPSEVLVLHAVADGEEDEVLVYKGMSSSLMRPTASDISEPVLPASATIKWIDRVESPYNYGNCKYIQKNVSWEDFQKLLEQRSSL